MISIKKYYFYIAVLILLLLPVVLIIYPNPYFYVLYDSEPDYFSNIVNLYVNGYTVDYLHPGLPITYISSALLKLTGATFSNPEELILTIRIFILYINILVIYFSVTRIAGFKMQHVLFLLSFFLIHPYGFYFFEIVSPNGLLVSLSVLLVLLGYNIEKSSMSPVWYGVILAFAALVLSIPLFLTITIKLIANVECDMYKRIAVLVSKSLFLFSLLFLFPIIPMLPFYLTQWSISFSEWQFGLFVLVVVGSFFYKDYLINSFKKNKKNYQEIYLFFAYVLFLVAALIAIFEIFNTTYFIESGAISRNSFLLFGFFALLINRKLKHKFFTYKKMHLLFFILVVSMKLYANTVNYDSAKRYDLEFNKFIDSQLIDNRKLIFFPVSTFSSKQYFILWSDYRYGDRINTFYSKLDSPLPFILDSRNEKIGILNYTYFNFTENISDKFSFKYFNNLIQNRVVSSVYNGILKNHEYLLHKKDICNKPYDDYHPNDRFVVVIPISGHYLDIKSSDDNSDHYKNVANMLSKSWRQCDYKVHIESENIEGNELLLLFIDSNRSNF